MAQELFSKQNFAPALCKALDEMTAEAREQIIKEAVKKFEAELRQNASKAVFAIIDMSYRVHADGHSVTIEITDARKKA